MITEEQFQAAEQCNTLQIIEACPGMAELMPMFLMLAFTAPPQALHTAFALMFGSICADIELNGGVEGDRSGFIDIDQRLRLFGIYAKTSYRETYLKAKELGLYKKEEH